MVFTFKKALGSEQSISQPPKEFPYIIAEGKKKMGVQFSLWMCMCLFVCTQGGSFSPSSSSSFLSRSESAPRKMTQAQTPGGEISAKRGCSIHAQLLAKFKLASLG